MSTQIICLLSVPLLCLNKHRCPFLYRQRKLWNNVLYVLSYHFYFSVFINVSIQSNKAKLGNSWVSPNVGHLILKYLCPALREVLQDGLKAYVLDLIIGQRRCQPWSLVEASTQLGENSTADGSFSLTTVLVLSIGWQSYLLLVPI